MNSLQFEPEMCTTQLCCALLWQLCTQNLNLNVTPQTQMSDIPPSNENNAGATTEKHEKIALNGIISRDEIISRKINNITHEIISRTDRLSRA